MLATLCGQVPDMLMAVYICCSMLLGKDVVRVWHVLADTDRRAGASEAGLVSMSRKRKSEVAKRPNTAHLRPLSQRTQDFFSARGISQSTLQRNGIRETPQGDIAFLYFRDGEVINIKYRSLDKRFWQVQRTPLTACPHGRWTAALCGQSPYAESNNPCLHKKSYILCTC